MDTIRICKECGQPLPENAPEGLCPACLAKVALETGSATSGGAAPGTVVAAESWLLPSASPSPRSALQIGQLFGAYRILRLLGRGGMGAVYEAEEIKSGRRLALKVMSQALVSEPDRKRFLREGRLAASVNHPNVVYILGSEEIGGAPVIAMELVRGGTLKGRLEKEGPLPVAEAVETTLQIIAGLEAAEKAGVLHRDIKPANCFVDADGTIKVGDFGLSISTLARGESLLTAAGSVLGTPAYASPEQLRGEALDAASDIYSTGATLYHLLTGRTPFRSPDFVKLITEVLDQQPEAPRQLRPEIPDALSRIVMRCLVKDRRARYRTYDELRNALLPFRAAAALPASPARRFLAGALDALLASGPAQLFACYWGYDPLDGLLFDRTIRSALVWLPFFLWYLLYFTIAEGRSGAAIGKTICGLRVIGPDGRAPGLLRALGRTLIYTAPTGLAAGLFLAFGMLRVDFLSPLPFLLLFVTMRRPNGYSAVQDLLTGTRVIVAPKTQLRPALSAAPPAPALDSSPSGPAAAGDGAVSPARKLGPYDLKTCLWETPAGELWEAIDPVLRRRIWIHLRPASEPPVSPVRRDLNRPARLHWLNGGLTEARLWDAYQACDGAPFLALAVSPQPWSAVRFWLLDLAEEMSAALKTGVAAPTLALDRVWVTASGRAMLLDFAWPDLSARRAPTAPLPLERAADMQAFLNLVAREALAGRGPGSVLGSIGGAAPCRGAAVPLHARSFLLNLTEGCFQEPEFMVGNLRSLIAKPARVSFAVRGASLAAVPMALLACAILFNAHAHFSEARWQRRWNTLYPGKPSLLTAAWIYDHALDRADGKDEHKLELTRAYLVSHFGELLTNDLFWTDHALTDELADEEELRASVTNHPAPTPEIIEEAEREVGAEIQATQAVPRSIIASMVALGGSILFALVEFFSAALFRQSLMLRLFGLAVVDRQGQPASRVRLLWRWAVVWGALASLTAVAEFLLSLGIVTRFRSLPDFPPVLTGFLARLQGISFGHPILVGLLTVAVIFILLVIPAALRPERGLADRLAGTRLVPR